MNDNNEIVPDDTGKQKAVAPAQEVSSSFPAEQATATQYIARPEFGDHVLYVHGDGVLDATIQVAFADGTATLRVLDPSNTFGYFDVPHVVQDTGKAQGTFHYA